MIVVSDTTPLISLMKADSLELLKGLFHEVLIPKAVYEELTTNPAFRDEAEQIRNSEFIKVVSVKEPKIVEIIRCTSGLDLGESEAIAYADQEKADALLMDEAKGRQVANSLGIHIMGTIGIFLFAYEEKLITASDVGIAFEKLKQANRHIGRDLMNYALDIINQKTNNQGGSRSG